MQFEKEHIYHIYNQGNNRQKIFFDRENYLFFLRKVKTPKSNTRNCVHYIHQNPVKAGWVQKATDWEFSSARDYAGFRNGKLVNKEVVRKYIININFD